MTHDPNPMSFLSDTLSGASPEVVEAIHNANVGASVPYGHDPLSRQVAKQFAEVFETDQLAVLQMASGTGANALALSLLAPPYSQVLCVPESHVHVHQCGAPEFYTGGAKLVPLGSSHGRLDPRTLADFLATPAADGPAKMPSAALSLTQATELGTVYSATQLGELASIARRHSVRVHLDGARFANSVATTGASPAELSWKAGITTLAYGATKNGALAAEALLIFDPALAAEARLRLKRGGQQWAKERFLSAQHQALLNDNLWLRNAHNANQQAARLAKELTRLPGIGLAHPVETNQVFALLPRKLTERLDTAGLRLTRWQESNDGVVVRLVCAFDTSAEIVDQLVETLRPHCSALTAAPSSAPARAQLGDSQPATDSR